MATRASFRFDPNRCTGCDACALACTIENGLDLGSTWRQVLHFNPRRHPAAPAFHLSLGCNHCAEPACLQACPTRAYRVDGATGAVLLDAARCIGCRYCTWACPYDAPRFDAARGVVTKCTFCVERLREGGAPACASLCPTGALGFEQLAEEEIRQEMEEFPARALHPALCILPLRPERRARSGDDGEELPPLACEIQLPRSPIHPAREWSLVAFTLLSSVLVGVLASRALAAAGFARPLLPVAALGWPAFLAATAVTLGLGGAHLGRKARAWRALANLRSSLLAREIAAFLLFAAAGALYLALAPHSALAGAVAAGFGWLLLFAIDQVYAVCVHLPPVARPHSAGGLLTGLFLAAVFAALAWPAALLGALKLGLYLRRRLWGARGGAGGAEGMLALPAPFGTRWWAALRCGLGFVLPGAAWAAGGREAAGLVLLGALAGEALDRCEYYAALQLESPQRDLTLALRARLAAAGRRRPAAAGPSAGLRPVSASTNL